jgi:2-oxo-3-hexenedioate decarboxylase
MTTAPSSPVTELQAMTAEVFAALDSGRQISPFSTRVSAFDLDQAYRVTATVRQMREARGEMPVGRKIGFTNRTIWAEYNVDRPVWGYMYDSTVYHLAEIDDTFSIVSFAEPRIEPEIVFRLASAPAPGMDERALLGCIDWVAHGFEIVQSIFPGWKFSVPDTVAGLGLHGALLIGPHHPIAERAEDWSRTLSSFEIELLKDGAVVDHGHSSNVLGGPLSALRHLVGILACDQFNPSLNAGELVTTGTLTRAFPVSAGATWRTELTGVALDSIRVRVT